MKLKKPKKHDYDYYAIVTEGRYANHLVYCDDYDDAGVMIVYLCDEQGEWSFTNGYLLMHRRILRKLPDQLRERNFLMSLPSLSQYLP